MCEDSLECSITHSSSGDVMGCSLTHVDIFVVIAVILCVCITRKYHLFVSQISAELILVLLQSSICDVLFMFGQIWAGTAGLFILRRLPSLGAHHAA